jgi:hypothetical protein
MEDLTDLPIGVWGERECGYDQGMLTAGVIAFCILLFVVAFLAPRVSRYLERGGDAPLGAAQRTAGKAPGPIGRLLPKPFGTGRKAVHKSGSAGRRGRAKVEEKL